jgi:phosphoglycolate phosphatase-like HAD superfamily hydrolase
MERHKLTPDQVLMVGDGMSDYEAAQAAGTRFLARETETSFGELAVDKVRDMNGMAEWLEGEE